jgi:hypothetical protein
MQSELGIQNDKSQLCYTMMRPVRFIHRSARDFLVDTNLGQKIRSYDRSSTDELALGCLRAAISKAHVLTKELGGHVDVRSILYHLHQLLRESSVERQQINLEILPIIREVYERGSLLYRRYAQVHPLPPMRVTFLMLVAGYNCIEDYLILSISQQSLLEVNAALYGACAGTMEITSQIVPINVTPWGLINAALGVGANPHLLWSFPNLNNKYHLMEHSAFSVFLSRAFDFTERDREDNSLAEKVLGTAATMASSCPNSRQKFLLAMSLGDRGFLILPHLMDLTYQRYPGHIVLEVDLRFLLQQVFALYTTGTITEANKDLERLDPARWSTDDSAIVRLVTDRAPGRSDVAMFKPLNQTPFKEIMDSLFLDYTSYNGAFKRDGSICDEIYHRISELLTDPCAVEEVDYDSELDALAAAGIGLRICKGLEAT